MQMFRKLRRRSARIGHLFRVHWRPCKTHFSSLRTALIRCRLHSFISETSRSLNQQKTWKVRPEVLWQHLPRDTEGSMKKRGGYPLSHVLTRLPMFSLSRSCHARTGFIPTMPSVPFGNDSDGPARCGQVYCLHWVGLPWFGTEGRWTPEVVK